MQAKVVTITDVYIRKMVNDGSGKLQERKYHVQHVVALQSYDSIVALYDVDYCELYLLPRYDYSVTTWRHLHRFINECTDMSDMDAKTMRESAMNNENNYNFAEAFAYHNGNATAPWVAW